MTDRITAWQCIGCGRIEAPQQCVGVCSDRKVELANAADLDAALAALETARRRNESLTAVVRQIAGTTPREGRCVETWRALQARAREALEAAGAG
jgi:hypothetical protein